MVEISDLQRIAHIKDVAEESVAEHGTSETDDIRYVT